MAKKKKKDVEENIENKEEFNDIDENFGLPDLDLEPLDDSDEKEVADEPVEEEDATASDIIESQEIVEEPIVEEEQEEIYVAPREEEDTHNEEEYPEETNEEATAENKPAYVPGSYAAKTREEGSNSGKIIGIIVVLLLAAGLLWYFMYFRPGQVAAEEAKQEQIAADKLKKEEARKVKEEQDRIAQEEADEAARLQAIEDAEPEIGTIETISEATSRYYVVVSSGIDGDLAMDYAKKEVNNGTNIKLLSPLGTNKFYRVTVADHDTWTAAENAANDLKATFGDDIWVLKY